MHGIVIPKGCAGRTGEMKYWKWNLDEESNWSWSQIWKYIKNPYRSVMWHYHAWKHKRFMKTLVTEASRKLCEAIDDEILRQVIKDANRAAEGRLPKIPVVGVDLGHGVNVTAHIVYSKESRDSGRVYISDSAFYPEKGIQSGH